MLLLPNWRHVLLENCLGDNLSLFCNYPCVWGYQGRIQSHFFLWCLVNLSLVLATTLSAFSAFFSLFSLALGATTKNSRIYFKLKMSQGCQILQLVIPTKLDLFCSLNANFLAKERPSGGTDLQIVAFEKQPKQKQTRKNIFAAKKRRNDAKVSLWGDFSALAS